ncbi:hypothetical protein ACWGS9_03275 [Bradyrhizobium sp. Arg314]
MNIEANTRKTAQLLDEIKTATASSSSALGGGSSSSGGSSGTTDNSAWMAAFNQAFTSAQSNYQAARMAGGGDGIVPFAQGLVATPLQIATNAANLATGLGGTKPVGLSGKIGTGFDSGGMIAPGDTQEVRFFKSPAETVGILTPGQMSALRGENQNQPAASNSSERPIVVNLTQNHNWNGVQPSKDS